MNKHVCFLNIIHTFSFCFSDQKLCLVLTMATVDLGSVRLFSFCFLAREKLFVTGKIVLVIKANDQEAAKKRLYFQFHPSILSKLLPVVEDIAEDNLGVDSETSLKISEEIDIIISSAATTTFDDSLWNFTGPWRIYSDACQRGNNLRERESDITLSIKGKKKLKYFVAMAKLYEPYAFFQAP
ncbi:putative oxidoreductase [Arabidopsis thaliana]